MTESDTRLHVIVIMLNSEDVHGVIKMSNSLVCILKLTILKSFYDDWLLVLGAFTNSSVGSNTASVCIVRV